MKLNEKTIDVLSSKFELGDLVIWRERTPDVRGSKITRCVGKIVGVHPHCFTVKFRNNTFGVSKFDAAVGAIRHINDEERELLSYIDTLNREATHGLFLTMTSGKNYAGCLKKFRESVFYNGDRISELVCKHFSFVLENLYWGVWSNFKPEFGDLYAADKVECFAIPFDVRAKGSYVQTNLI